MSESFSCIRSRLLSILLSLAICCALAAPGAFAGEISDPLRERIEDFVRSRADYPVTEVTVPPLGSFDLEGVDAASIQVDLSTRAMGLLPRSVPVTVVISDSDRVLKRGIVTVRVRTERLIVVAARSIRRGESIGPKDLRVARRDAAAVPDSATHDEEQLVGMVATRSISSGTPIRTDWIEQPAVIKRGQRVRLILQSAQLRIEATGVASSKGAVGDTIRVVNSDSRREVSGQIGPDGAVHVAF